MSQERGREFNKNLGKRRVLLAGLFVFSAGCSSQIENSSSNEQTRQSPTPKVSESAEVAQYATETKYPSRILENTPNITSTHAPVITTTPLPEYLNIINQNDDVGLIGTHLMVEKDIPDQFITPSTQENIETYRFIDGSGNPLDYGVFDNITVDERLYRLYVHAIFRGFVLENVQDPTGLGGSRYFLMEVPYNSGQRQFILGFVPNQQESPIPVYSVKNNLVNDISIRQRTYQEVLNSLESVPDGTSIIVGISNYASYHSEEEQERNNVIAQSIINENLINTPYLYGASIDDIYMDERFID